MCSRLVYDGGMDDRTVTLAELTDYLRVHRTTVQRWIRAGLPVINVGSVKRPDWRFVLGEVRTWLDDRAVKAHDGEVSA